MSPEELAEIEKAAHKPGDPHEYSLTCKVCGQPGVIRLTIDPQHDLEAHLEYEALAARLAEAEAAVVTARERAEALEAAVREVIQHADDTHAAWLDRKDPEETDDDLDEEWVAFRNRVWGYRALTRADQ